MPHRISVAVRFQIKEERLQAAVPDEEVGDELLAGGADADDVLPRSIGRGIGAAR